MLIVDNETIDTDFEGYLFAPKGINTQGHKTQMRGAFKPVNKWLKMNH